MSKRRRLLGFTSLRSAHNAERGMTLIEILVALGILAAVAVVFLLGMATSSRAVMVSQEAVAADSLAKSELEYVKSVDYNALLPSDPPSDPLWEYQLPGNPPTWDLGRTLPADYLGYSVEVSGRPVGAYLPAEIQEITVIVRHNEETAFTLVGYKVNR